MKNVLITGGSEGIGFAFACHYASVGWHVILAARRLSLLEKAKAELTHKYSCSVDICPVDLSVIGNGEFLYNRVDGKNLDVLINCAGYGLQNRAHRIPVETDEKMVIVNDIALMTLSKLFIRDHLPRHHGMIINVSSTGAFQPGPNIVSYYASKSFVLSYSQSLDAEVKSHGVRVYCLCPGPVDTAFYHKSGGKMSAYHMSAEDTVSWCMKHLGRNCVIVPGMINQLLRLIPIKIRIYFLSKMKNVQSDA